MDTLFGGAVPERETELRTLWGQQVDRVRLLDAEKFLLHQLYGTIQVNEIALRQIWLTGYAAWRAIEAYSDPLKDASQNHRAFDPLAWNTDPTQAGLDADFDGVLGEVGKLSKVRSLNDFDWPADVPFPEVGLKLPVAGEKAAFDLVCMAGAYVFAHEIRHALFEAAGDAPDDILKEELACDAWALGLMLDGAEDYERQHHPDLHGSVRAKRILGILIAQLTILAVTPRPLWDNSTDHPSVRDRLRAVLDAVTDPTPDWFWLSVASMLTAFSRYLGTLGAPVVCPADCRVLAYNLCDGFRSA
ncbi:hypothetical protein MKL20_24685 [Methylobacterium sp. E-066]|nr:hypothetical protein [Methylobacterium sp. E-066]